jgi:hypothetical protein
MPFTGTRTAYCYSLPFRKTFKLQTMKVSRLASFLASSLIPQPSAFSQENDSPTIRVSSLAHAFIANPLSTRTSLDVDEYTMYVRTVDLPKVGLLDGDWVSANCNT